MGRYFGTDGFRGLAGSDLTAEHAFTIGRILGHMAAESAKSEGTAEGGGKCAHARIVIGKDTRRSGYMLESALAAGITASGADAYLMHVTTTPSVAYITRMDDFSFGVMISASHNPYGDNGIKVLAGTGEKLDEDTTNRIEDLMDGDLSALGWTTDDAIGCVVDFSESRDRYADYLISLARVKLEGKKIAIDCANGGSYAIAPRVFRALGAEVHVLSNEPNGLNINVECGSTHPEALCAYVREHALDAGFAFDGDADRCLAVDENGTLVNGDEIMFACGLHMKEQGHLANNTVVTTIMSNFGLYKALDAAGIAYEKTAVGDKYVWENMRENGHMIGGEQSGHVIFGEYARTGDGILTAIMVENTMIETGKSLSELVAPCQMYPQVLKNVRVDSKDGTLADGAVKAAIAAADTELGDTGRTLVRKSGTEPVIRVMAEAPAHEICEKHVDAIIAAMRESGHLL